MRHLKLRFHFWTLRNQRLFDLILMACVLTFGLWGMLMVIWAITQLYFN